jgi:hypothetical protein
MAMMLMRVVTISLSTIITKAEDWKLKVGCEENGKTQLADGSKYLFVQQGGWCGR